MKKVLLVVVFSVFSTQMGTLTNVCSGTTISGQTSKTINKEATDACTSLCQDKNVKAGNFNGQWWFAEKECPKIKSPDGRREYPAIVCQCES